jgi:hypothetical protein
LLLYLLFLAVESSLSKRPWRCSVSTDIKNRTELLEDWIAAVVVGCLLSFLKN